MCMLHPGGTQSLFQAQVQPCSFSAANPRESPLGSRSLLFVRLHGLPGCLLPSFDDQIIFSGFSSKLVPSLHILSPAWKTPCHSKDRAEVVVSSLLPSHPFWEGPKCNDTQQTKWTSSIPYF